MKKPSMPGLKPLSRDKVDRTKAKVELKKAQERFERRLRDVLNGRKGN